MTSALVGAAPKDSGPCGASPTFLSRVATLLLLLLLAPPLLWLGIIYLGALFALLAAEPVLDRRVLRRDRLPADAARPMASFSPRPISTSSSAPLVISAVVTARSRRSSAFPSPITRRATRADKVKALFYVAVMMPLWSSYLVKVYAWKLLLAKEGAVGWLMQAARPVAGARRLARRAAGRRPVALGQLHRHGADVSLSLDCRS